MNNKKTGSRSYI